MKIYEAHQAPNARRVRLFLAEKGIADVDFIPVDLVKGENLSDEFRRKNPMAQVPVLELDDGTCISESMAICRYFEASNADKPLMGASALEQAEIEMWNRRVELGLLTSVFQAFRHTTGYFKDRETVFKDWGEENAKHVHKHMAFLDQHLERHAFIAGDTLSVADITALCAIDFAKVIRIRVEDNMPHLKRWYEAMRERPSYEA